MNFTLKTSFVLACLLLLMLVTACRRDPPEPEPDLPPETQEGKDTFGCYLNGVPWKPSQKEWGNNTLYVQFDGTYFTLYAYHNDNGRNERISFFSASIQNMGQYPIGKLALNGGSICNFWDIAKNKPIVNSADNDVISDGLLTITKFDMNQKIISGKFWFKLQKNDGTTIEAKEGRFDISF